MTRRTRSNNFAAQKRTYRLLLPVFLISASAVGLLWLLEPPVVHLPAELESLQPPELDVQMDFTIDVEVEDVDAEVSAPEQLETDEEFQVTGLISTTGDIAQGKQAKGDAESAEGQIYWAFPDEGSPDPVLHVPGLVQLPETVVKPMEEPAAEDKATRQDELLLMPPMPDVELVEQHPDPPRQKSDEELADTDLALEAPIAVLMPPTEVPAAAAVQAQPNSETELDISPESEQSPRENFAYVAPITPTTHDLTDIERQLVDQVIREARQGVTGEMTDSRLNEVAREKIQQANAMARRGTPYAARQKLIEVLRMVSQAKDVRSQKLQYSAALASGLRALDEAEDFLPQGAQLEAELDVGLVAGAHRTPLAKHLDLTSTLPQQMLDRYLRYAQLKMAMAVAGDPAGSMALYALGKVSSQMAEIDLPRHELAHREAVAYQQAALLAHNQNHYAAHELAVLLAKSGHYGSAHYLLCQVAARRPNPMVLRNLARVQKRLGLTAQSRASYDRAGRLAATEGSSLIDWVPPQQFARSSTPTQQPSKQRIASQPSATVRR